MNPQLPPPTCQQLHNDELEEVYIHDDTSWRHGFYRTVVFHRKEDGTYWQADYCKSTDGETNGLREGDATIIRVWPYEVKTTRYTNKSPNPASTP